MKELGNSFDDLDAQHTRGNRAVLNPTSHNIRQQGKQHEAEPQEKLTVQENQPIQTQDDVSLANSSIQKNTKEAYEVSLARTNKIKAGSKDDLEEPAPIWKGKQREALPYETGAESKGKGKPITAHAALSLPYSTSQGNVAPPRTLRSTRRGRKTPDPRPTRELMLDTKTVEHLKPLTELECVSRTRDIELWHAEWTSLCTVSKIAEGSFGSVFRMSDKKNSQPETIGKLMPLRAKSGIGSRKFSNTAIEAAASEVKLLELMSDVPGFVVFRDAEVLIGALPRALQNEYRAFTAKETGTDRDNTVAGTWFPKHQAWLFIEMDNAGVELDSALTGATGGLLNVSMTGDRFLTVQRTRDIFWGVVEALMRGEQMHRFEHRDLHLSNICVQLNTGEEVDSGYELIPHATNVDVTIIDYTLARATMPDDSIIFNPMKDENIFTGDGTLDLQYDIYRHMRELVANPRAASQGWDGYVPITNVLWLSHLLKKLIQLTPRPQGIQEELELWQLLYALNIVIDVDYRWSWDLLSACDVARYMQVGKKEFGEEMKKKEKEGWKDLGEGGMMEPIRGARSRRILAAEETAGWE